MGLELVAEQLRIINDAHSFPTPGKRKEKLLKLKNKIISEEKRLSLALKEDLQKSEFESYLTEIGFIIEEINFALKNISDWCKPKKVKTPLNLFPAKSYIHPSPYGVVLIISPWNYPFQLCLSPLIGAISAGNRVVVKPSEFAPQTSKMIKLILEEVFESSEVIVVEGGIEETQILLKQKFDYIFFTGSTPVGKIIMKAAAEHLTPITLELGGKSPLLICESADLDLAAKRCAWGKFINAGQTCVAPDYVLVPHHLQDEFIDKVRNYLVEFYGTSPAESPDYPRIINDKHFDRLASLIDMDKVAIGGEVRREDRYIAPTVFRDVNWKNKLMDDEIFGPLLPVLPYQNLNEAISQIKTRPAPLAFYIFSEDITVRNEILNNIPFGGGCINDTVMHLANPYLPFGGSGMSGMGSYHGFKSFETFTHFKSVLIQNTKVDIPMRYPPYFRKLSWLKKFVG